MLPEQDNPPIEDSGIIVDPGELAELCLFDHALFESTFFPKTVRQGRAPFHEEIERVLDDPRNRFINLRSFRGSAKTSKLRTFAAKRVAYGLSRTILAIGASEAHSERTIAWLKSSIERNPRFAQFYGLKPGRKWQQTEIEIELADGSTVWVLGVGITGNIRGINFEDYRPDLILLDDVLTDENTATADQRHKINNLILGAVMNSLAPATEEPNAKLAMLQTPLHKEDASMEAEKDERFVTLTIPCWTPETMYLPLPKQESAWPERFPSETLRRDKLAMSSRNLVSVWNREMEVRLTAAEQNVFRPTWLRRTEEMPAHAFKVLSIDPVPPPSPQQLAKGLRKKDFEAIGVIGRSKGNYYVYEYETNRTPTPASTCQTVLSMAQRHGVARIVVEGVAYQRVLGMLLEDEMRRQGLYFPVLVVPSTQDKFSRISTTLSGPAHHGKLWCHPTHVELIEQFESYSEFYTDHDDVLDMTAIGVRNILAPYLEQEQSDDMYEEPAYEIGERCP